MCSNVWFFFSVLILLLIIIIIIAQQGEEGEFHSFSLLSCGIGLKLSGLPQLRPSDVLGEMFNQNEKYPPPPSSAPAMFSLRRNPVVVCG